MKFAHKIRLSELLVGDIYTMKCFGRHTADTCFAILLIGWGSQKYFSSTGTSKWCREKIRFQAPGIGRIAGDEKSKFAGIFL